MLKRIIIAFFISLSGGIFAQQDAMFTHYSFNTLSVNPGYAGSRNAMTLTALHRSQWVTFPGAPTTQTVTLHAPIRNENLGVGFAVMNDVFGPVRSTGVTGDFAYKIRTGDKGKLAFGLKAGLRNRGVDLASLQTLEENDPGLQEGDQSQFLPNFGFGLYYNLPRFYAGFSIPELLENDFNISSNPNSTAENQRHYYFIAGGVFDLNESKTLMLKPTTFVKMTNGAGIEFDLTALVYYKSLVWFGPMFRLGDGIGALAGLNITDQFSLGYSFDWSFTNGTGRYNGGSHELMLRYDFIFNEKVKIESPRHF